MTQQEQPRVMVKQAVVRERGWRQDDVMVSEVKALARRGCTFYRASNPARIDQQPVQYAVLPDGQVARAPTEVLRRFGDGASADWWAQVITRLGGARGTLVDEHAPSAIRKIHEAGAEWAPTLRRSAAGVSLAFYTVDYELGGILHVQASLPAQGDLTVTAQKIA